MSISNISVDSIKTTIAAGVTYPVKIIAKGYDYYNHTVEELTEENLSPTVAKVVREFARALPFTLLTLTALFLPTYIFIPVTVSGVVWLNNQKNELLTNRQKQTCYNSLGITNVILAGKCVTSIISGTQHPILLGIAAVCMVALGALNFYDGFNQPKEQNVEAPLHNVVVQGQRL